jgi:hypothetical protein
MYIDYDYWHWAIIIDAIRFRWSLAAITGHAIDLRRGHRWRQSFFVFQPRLRRHIIFAAITLFDYDEFSRWHFLRHDILLADISFRPFRFARYYATLFADITIILPPYWYAEIHYDISHH